MAKFEVMTENLSKKADKLEESKTTLDDYRKELSSKFDSLIDSWDAMSSKRLINRMNTFTNSELSRFIEILVNYSEYLKKSAQAYEELDSVYASETIDV